MILKKKENASYAEKSEIAATLLPLGQQQQSSANLHDFTHHTTLSPPLCDI